MVYCGRGIFLILSESLSASGKLHSSIIGEGSPRSFSFGIGSAEPLSVKRKIHTMIVSIIEEDNPRLFDRKKLHKQRQPTDIPPTKRKRREHHPLPAQFTRENFLFCPSQKR